jgi:hypothetical protein
MKIDEPTETGASPQRKHQKIRSAGVAARAVPPAGRAGRNAREKAESSSPDSGLQAGHPLTIDDGRPMASGRPPRVNRPASVRTSARRHFTAALVIPEMN